MQALLSALQSTSSVLDDDNHFGFFLTEEDGADAEVVPVDGLAEKLDPIAEEPSHDVPADTGGKSPMEQPILAAVNAVPKSHTEKSVWPFKSEPKGFSILEAAMSLPFQSAALPTQSTVQTKASPEKPKKEKPAVKTAAKTATLHCDIDVLVTEFDTRRRSLLPKG